MHVSANYFKGTPLEAGFGAAKSAAVQRLQNALRMLAAGTRDTALNVVADGLIGPKTTAATNRALTRHIGAGQAPAQYRTGALSQAQVLAAAAALAGVIEVEAARRGVRSPPPVAARAPATRAPASRTAAPRAAAAPRVAKSANILKLQQAILRLRKVTGDQALNIVADGLIGPKTTAAVNQAFRIYVAPERAPAAYRTGTLLASDVLRNAPALTAILDQQTKSGAKPPAVAQQEAARRAASTAATAARQAAARTAAARKAGQAPPPPQPMPDAITPDQVPTYDEYESAAAAQQPASRAAPPSSYAQQQQQQQQMVPATYIPPSEVAAERQAAAEAVASEKKGLPGWAWAAIGVGSVVIVGGVIYMISRRGAGGRAEPTMAGGEGEDDPNFGFSEDELDTAAEAAA